MSFRSYYVHVRKYFKKIKMKNKYRLFIIITLVSSVIVKRGLLLNIEILLPYLGLSHHRRFHRENAQNFLI